MNAPVIIAAMSAAAIFTVVNAVLLKPLPYTHGERWIALFAGSTHDPDFNHISGLSFADLLAYQERMRDFDVFGWFPVGGDFNLSSPGQPRHIEGVEVSPSLIANTGANPVAGRFFTASDGPNVALISHRLFTQLGRGILGRPITLNGESYIVVGAMPAWFRLPLGGVSNQKVQDDVWLPLKRPRDEATLRNYSIYGSYGRLKLGVTVGQARARMRKASPTKSGARITRVTPRTPPRSSGLRTWSSEASAPFCCCSSALPDCCYSSPALTWRACWWADLSAARANPPFVSSWAERKSN